MNTSTFYPVGTECYRDPSRSSCFVFGNSGSGALRKVSKDGEDRYAFTGPLSMTKSCDSVYIFDNQISYNSANPGTHRHSAPGHSAFGHSAPGHSAPRTLRSQDIQLPGHSGLLDIQVFRTLRSQDIQLPGHSGLLDIQLFWTSRSFGHPALLDICWYWIYHANTWGMNVSWRVSVCPSGTGLGNVYF